MAAKIHIKFLTFGVDCMYVCMLVWFEKLNLIYILINRVEIWGYARILTNINFLVLLECLQVPQTHHIFKEKL